MYPTDPITEFDLSGQICLDSASWTSTGSGSWSRTLTAPDGSYAGVQTSGTVTYALTDPHGDVIATLSGSSGVGLPASSQVEDYTEWGAPRASSPTPITGYGWLGAHQRSNDDLAGLTLMGVRLYDPVTGRFLTPDPVPGGNANAYVYPTNPITGFDLTGLSDVPAGGGYVYSALEDRKSTRLNSSHT